MNSIQTSITAALPAKRKQTPSGWISFDAPCCIHNGEGADKRKRGGMMFNGDGTISYHCFNCGYTTSYVPGRNISYKMRKLLGWLGMPDSEITRISLEALKLKENSNDEHVIITPTFETKKLASGASLIADRLRRDDVKPEDLESEFIGAVEYILGRGLMVDDYDFMWTPEGSYKSRLIIPFYYQGDIVGYTARKIGDGSPKYITDSQPGYVFNLDRQNYYRRYCFVVEGPIDAISIDGVAVLRNDISDQQAMLINSLQRQVVVVPDRDKAGQDLVESALHYGWCVSFPPWDKDIKDVNDAVRKYGRIYTLKQIINSIETNKLKIEVVAKTYFND